jgi:hypothetical protein
VITLSPKENSRVLFFYVLNNEAILCFITTLTHLPIYLFTHLQIQKAPSGFYEVYCVRIAVFSKELMTILVLWAQTWLCKYSARTLKLIIVFHDVWSWFGCRPDGFCYCRAIRFDGI